MFKRLLFIFALLAFFTGAAHAQNSTSLPDASNSKFPQNGEQNAFGSPAEEVRQRAMIRHEENSHKEMIGRAAEAAQLGAELRTTFERNKTLGRDDLKKLERLEKLARKIRGNAGGSNDDEELINPPAQLPEALDRLETISGDLNKSVQKTSRLVVSAAVIERSNELIELIRHIRTFVQP
jgi:hypothetical protein